MRNREVRLYCLAMAAVALVVTGMVYQWAPQAVPAFLCGFGALCLLSARVYLVPVPADRPTGRLLAPGGSGRFHPGDPRSQGRGAEPAAHRRSTKW